MFKDKFKEQLDTATPNLNRPHHQAEQFASICKEISVGFAEWVVNKHKQYPDYNLRYDKLFDIYEQEQSGKLKTMIHPKQKAIELYEKISQLSELTHSEVLEILDFVAETKILSQKINQKELGYWEQVRLEAKKIKP